MLRRVNGWTTFTSLFQVGCELYWGILLEGGIQFEWRIGKGGIHKNKFRIGYAGP